ncbi:hypothetical protein [Mycobacteroides abscessus]|uniref:hypothetical protein n=1 Tax=Mycobacteroides abscessus TaxID=36809 RepID=UPI00038581C9|nr:hypothetical protein [Mycobacteroides abscessus]EPZ18841.1 hypothetical protein M879_19770 [Mycobacteroides abscessus V06705]MDO3267871.1 hypothetical protein [Mycobacteroides abscessus subsp. abscessus]
MREPNDPTDESEQFRPEIDAAGFDAVAGHLREGATAINDSAAKALDPRLVAKINADKASTRASVRGTSRSIQALGDEYRRQNGI